MYKVGKIKTYLQQALSNSISFNFTSRCYQSLPYKEVEGSTRNADLLRRVSKELNSCLFKIVLLYNNYTAEESTNLVSRISVCYKLLNCKIRCIHQYNFNFFFKYFEWNLGGRNIWNLIGRTPWQSSTGVTPLHRLLLWLTILAYDLFNSSQKNSVTKFEQIYVIKLCK